MTSKEIRATTDGVRIARNSLLLYGVKAIVGDDRHRQAIAGLDIVLAQLENDERRAVRAERRKATAQTE